MLDKFSEMHGTLKDISKQVSNLVKHLTKTNENTAVKEIVTVTTDTTSEILKEMAGTLKEILNAKTSQTNNQPSEIPESTQVLIEQEAEKIKQSMIQTWDTKLKKKEQASFGRWFEMKTLPNHTRHGGITHQQSFQENSKWAT